MTDQDILSKIAEALHLEVSELKRDASFLDDLELDSLDLVEMVMNIEDEFDIELPQEDFASIKTVGALVDYIKDKSK